MKQFAIIVILFICTLVVGAMLVKRPRFSVVKIDRKAYNSADQRSPAAIRKVNDYSNLVGSSLHSAVQSHLIAESKVVKSEQGPGIQLGHFVVRGKNGEKVFACEEYNLVELTFRADGVLESGDQPVMQVEAPCRYSQNINEIDPIWIPVKELTKDRPGNMDLTLNADSQPLRFRFKDMPPFWPNKWVLSRIRLYNKEQQAAAIELDNSDFRRLSPTTMAIYFH